MDNYSIRYNAYNVTQRDVPSLPGHMNFSLMKNGVVVGTYGLTLRENALSVGGFASGGGTVERQNPLLAQSYSREITISENQFNRAMQISENAVDRDMRYNTRSTCTAFVVSMHEELGLDGNVRSYFGQQQIQEMNPIVRGWLDKSIREKQSFSQLKAFSGFDFKQGLNLTDVTPRCFIAGTQILMADGSRKPIEEIDVDDIVMSFDGDAEDGLGASVPRRVTKTFTNITRVLIDLWGLRVTPGHEFLADGGEFMRIADILRKDRCFVRQVDGKGVSFRARTNLAMKTLGDVLFRTRFKDPRTGAWRKASVRGDIPFERVLSETSGILIDRMASLIEVLHHNGRLCVQTFASNGQLRDPKGRTIGVIEWPEGRTPFDAEGAENHVVLLDDAPFVPDWVKNIPRDGEEQRAVMNAGGGPNDLLLLGPGGMVTMTTADGQGQWNPPAPRQQLPRPALRLVSG
jgi:hypothetical protein